MSNDYLAPLLPKLTVNAALSLRSWQPNADDHITVATGLGKWTTLSMLGVFANLRKLGLAENRGPYRSHHITPLGKEMAAYLAANWDDIDVEWHDPMEKKRLAYKRRVKRIMAEMDATTP